MVSRRQLVLAEGQARETGDLEPPREAATVWRDLFVSPDECVETGLQNLPLTAGELARLRRLPHRPRLSILENGVFLALLAAKTSPDGLTTTPLTLLFGTGWLTTIHDEPVEAVDSTWESVLHDPPGQSDTGEVLYRLLYTFLESYLSATNGLVKELETISTRFLKQPYANLSAEFLRIRTANASLRQALDPEREAFYALKDPHLKYIGEKERDLFEDLSHFGQMVASQVAGIDDSLSALIQAYASVQSNTMGRTVYVLTIVTTLAVPATVVASIYGMNFHIPEIHWPFGYAYALTLIAVLTGALWIYLKRRHWL